MNGSQLREALRRADVGCAHRARWLGLRKPEGTSEHDAAAETLRRVKEEIRQALHHPGHFNQG